MKGVKVLLYVIALLLFILNYHICDYFYYNEEIKDINKWWDLKSNIYAIILMLFSLATLIKTKGFVRFLLSLTVGFCISNVIDKVFCNVLTYTKEDATMIVLTFVFSYIDFFKNGRKDQ